MKILSFIDKHLEEILCSILLAVMTIIIFLQIVFRVFNFPLAWTEEIARYLFIWLIYVACAGAIARRKHITVDILDLFLKARGRFILNLFSTFVVLVFSIVLFWYSIPVVERVIAQVAPATRISMAFPYSSIMVGSGLMTLRAIQDIIRRLKEGKEEEDYVA